jgi:hypothetical protein
LPIPPRPFNVSGLLSLISAAQQENAGLTNHAVIHSIAWTVFDSEFKQPTAKGLAIAEVSFLDPVDSVRNSCTCIPVDQNHSLKTILPALVT